MWPTHCAGHQEDCWETRPPLTLTLTHFEPIRSKDPSTQTQCRNCKGNNSTWFKQAPQHCLTHFVTATHFQKFCQQEKNFCQPISVVLLPSVPSLLRSQRAGTLGEFGPMSLGENTRSSAQTNKQTNKQTNNKERNTNQAGSSQCCAKPNSPRSMYQGNWHQSYDGQIYSGGGGSNFARKQNSKWQCHGTFECIMVRSPLHTRCVTVGAEGPCKEDATITRLFQNRGVASESHVIRVRFVATERVAKTPHWLAQWRTVMHPVWTRLQR